MRAVVVSIVVAGVALAARPLSAAPPQDLPTYCRSVNPNMQAQVRCLYTEKAAQSRAASTRASVQPDAWSRCEGTSASWTAMESCLANARASASTPGGGAAPAGGGEQARPDQGGTAAAPSGGAAAPGSTAAVPPAESAATPPAAVTGTPSTVILGPRGGAASAAAEANRPTRPVTEAEAERHLKGVLERSGDPQARCTKKQYGAGWVTVCE
jgi:hypothetical protein